jgi:hypothetical protein
MTGAAQVMGPGWIEQDRVPRMAPTEPSRSAWPWRASLPAATGADA